MSGQVNVAAREVPVSPDFPELLRGIDGVIWEADAQSFVFSYVSPQSRAILGYEPEEWLASPTFWADHLHPADREWAVGFCVAQTGEARDHEFEYRMIAKDGRVVWVRDLVWIVRDASGRPTRLRGLLTDITRRKQAELRVALQQECASLLALAPSVQEAVPALLGAIASRMGWTSGSWWRVEGERCAARAAWPSVGGTAVADGGHAEAAERVRASGARVLPAADAARPVLAAPVSVGRHLIGALVFSTPADIAAEEADASLVEAIGAQLGVFLEREEAERALDRSERRRAADIEAQRNRLDAIVRSVPGVVWEAWGSPDAKAQRIDFVSEHVERMLGYTREEWLSTPNFWLSIVHPDDRERAARESAAQFESGEGGTLEFRWIRKDGSVLWAQGWNVVIKDDQGRPIGMRGVTVDVSERRRLDAQLRESRERLDLALSAAELGAWDLDLTTDTAVRSLRHDQIFGYPEGTADWSAERFFHHVIPEHRERVKAAFDQAFAEGRLLFDCAIRRADGTLRWIDVQGRVLREGVRPVRMLGVVADVTERRRVEDELEHERKMLASVLEQMPAGVVIAEVPTGRLLLANPQFNRILQHEFIPLEGMDQYSRYPVMRTDGTPLPLEENPMARAIAKGEVVSGEELLFRRGDGEVIRLLVNAAPVRDAQGKMIAAIAAFVDITERARAAALLREKDERLRAALDASGTGTFRWDIASHSLDWDDNLDRLFGLPVGQTARRLDQFTRLVHPEDRPAVLKALEGCVQDGADFDMEFRVVWPDGSVHWLLDRGRMVRDAEGRPLYMAGACTDVTRRKQVEEEMRHQRDLVSTITDNAASALFMMDDQGRPVFFNEAAKAMTGYASVEEIRSKPLHDAIHFRKPDGAPYPIEECPIDQASAQIRPLRDQREVFCRKDGTLFPVAYNVAPITMAGGRRGAVLEVRDITDQLRAETALRERADELARLAERLQRTNVELDQFAYVTSHDLKAPLRGIANLSRWIEEDLAERITPESRQQLELLRGRVHRMEGLIDAILEYSRVGRVKQSTFPVDVGRLLRETVDLVSPPAGFQVELPDGLPVVEAPRGQLQQVFMNLIANAIKHHHRDEGVIRIGCEDAGSHWRFSVADDGPGIDPRFHDKVFVIFQTLRPRDKVEGAGVGLALVKKIVETHGGAVALESEEGKGATFRFTWPKVPQET